MTLEGQTFGNWSIVEPRHGISALGGVTHPAWLCQCICGTERVVCQSSLISKHSQSCGCGPRPGLRKDVCKRGHVRTENTVTSSGNCKRCVRLIAKLSLKGLTEQQYGAYLVSQNNCCAVCFKPFETKGANRPCIDHARSCCPGERSCGLCVRGLICFRCNTLIGFIETSTHLLSRVYQYIGKKQ